MGTHQDGSALISWFNYWFSCWCWLALWKCLLNELQISLLHRQEEAISSLSHLIPGLLSRSSWQTCLSPSPYSTKQEASNAKEPLLAARVGLPSRPPSFFSGTSFVGFDWPFQEGYPDSPRLVPSMRVCRSQRWVPWPQPGPLQRLWSGLPQCPRDPQRERGRGPADSNPSEYLEVMNQMNKVFHPPTLTIVPS